MRRNLIIGLAVALAVGIGADCGGVGGGPHNDPFPPPVERPEVKLVIETNIQPDQPYLVVIDIKGGNGAYPPQVPIAAGPWRHELIYRSGVAMTIDISVGGFKPRINPHSSFCRITDGSKVSENYGTGERKEKRIRCTLTTQQ